MFNGPAEYFSFRKLQIMQRIKPYQYTLTIRIAFSVLLTTTLVTFQSNTALGFTLNVRQLAMGEVTFPGKALSAQNYAYQAIQEHYPYPSFPKLVSLPLGLLQLESLYSNADPISLVDVALSPPWHMKIDPVESWLSLDSTHKCNSSS